MNTVILTGYLGAAPEIEESNDVTYARLSLATNERFTTKEGERVERTDWHRIVAFGGLAKSLVWLDKGARVGVRGRLQVNTYVKDGEKRTRVEVLAAEIEFLDRRGKEEEPAGEGE